MYKPTPSRKADTKNQGILIVVFTYMIMKINVVHNNDFGPLYNTILLQVYIPKQ